MNSSSIAFVGLGRMGANMARCLKAKGFTISALYDLNSTVARELSTELKTVAVATLPEITALADIIITVVTDDAAMLSLFQSDALLKDMQNAQGKLFINCATVSPATHQHVEQLTSQVGAQSLEACMASSIPQALEGSLYLMCAGQAAAYARAQPILNALSSQCRYIGPSGSAAQVKALVNMVMNINTAGLAEGLGLGHALGLDLNILREVFSETGANSRVLVTDGDDMQNRDHACFFSAAHAAKDSAIALELSKQEGLSLPLALATFLQYQKMIDLGLGELDKSGVAELTFKDRLEIPRNDYL